MTRVEPPHKRRCTVCDRAAVVFGVASDSLSPEWCAVHGIDPETKVELDLCAHCRNHAGAR